MKTNRHKSPSDKLRKSKSNKRKSSTNRKTGSTGKRVHTILSKSKSPRAISPKNKNTKSFAVISPKNTKSFAVKSPKTKNVKLHFPKSSLYNSRSQKQKTKSIKRKK